MAHQQAKSTIHEPLPKSVKLPGQVLANCPATRGSLIPLPCSVAKKAAEYQKMHQRAKPTFSANYPAHNLNSRERFEKQWVNKMIGSRLDASNGHRQQPVDPLTGQNVWDGCDKSRLDVGLLLPGTFHSSPDAVAIVDFIVACASFSAR